MGGELVYCVVIGLWIIGFSFIKLHVNNIEVITSHDYLLNPVYSDLKQIRLVNLCESYKYQSCGYYVSLLAAARDHRVFPSVQTIQDLSSPSIVRVVSDELDALIQKSLSKIKSTEFDLSIYFGKNIAQQYEKLSVRLYNLFQSPLLRARFIFNKKWILQNIVTISLKDVPDYHRSDLMRFADLYFSRYSYVRSKKNRQIYDLAILYDAREEHAPSNSKAIQCFIQAANQIGFKAQCISKYDFNKVPFYDALFIRETTAVNHHTYLFSRRAASEGLVVLDDPESIIKCTNKVYLAELFNKNDISCPKTYIVDQSNQFLIPEKLGFPCVLKLPDGSFSRSVVKVEDEKSLTKILKRYFLQSCLLIAQEFIPTDYDWRIAVLNHQVIFACKYYMAEKHWQIYNWDAKKLSLGGYEAVPLAEVSPAILKLALKTTRLIGNGLYGVDLKQIGKKNYVVEVNDNPNIDAGVEDVLLGKTVYLNVMQYFMHQVLSKKQVNYEKQLFTFV